MTVPADPDQALEALMAHYGDMVLRLAYFYTRDRGRAEDVAQEAFLRAYRNWTRFRGQSAVKTWLYRITVNCAHDYLRTRTAREQPVEPPAWNEATPGADEAAVAQLERSRVLHHVVALPPEQREAIFLFYYMDMSLKEAAESLGIPEGTIRSRLHRAREALRVKLEKEGVGA